jgi:phage baseplate assembly protein V
MIGPFANAMRLQALRALSDKVSTLTGIVTNYDPNKYAVKVTLQPDGVKTGYIPLAAYWVGNGWGLFMPPNIGDQISVTFEDGNLNAGFAESRFYNAANVPVSVPSGEFLLQHKTGSLLHFKNNGSVEFDSHTDMVLNVGGKLNATVTGDLQATVSGNMKLDASSGTAEITATTLTVNGKLAVTGTSALQSDVTVTGTLTASTDVKTGTISLKNHTHTSASPGTPTSPPIP